MIERLKSGGVFEDKIGYSRSVVAGGFIHVSGCVAPGEDVPETIQEQCAAILEVISDSLGRAGASFCDVVRVTYIVPEASEFPKCWPQLRSTFGAHPPAATMICARLIDPKYLIEIEVTALSPTT